MVKKWTILDQKWPNMAGFSTLQSGPKGSKMVNLTAIDHLGSFWAHLGASEPFQTKTDFFLGLSECWPFQVFESAPMSRNQYEFGKEQYAFCPLRLMLNHKSQSLCNYKYAYLAQFAYLGAPNMVKWGVLENILQNIVQTRCSWVNRSLQLKVVIKSNFWLISPLQL